MRPHCTTFIINRRTLADLLLPQNSPHFKNEQRKQKQTDERIAKMKQRAQSISQAELAGLTGYYLQDAPLCNYSAHDSCVKALMFRNDPHQVAPGLSRGACIMFPQQMVVKDVQGLRKCPGTLWSMLDIN